MVSKDPKESVNGGQELTLQQYGFLCYLSKDDARPKGMLELNGIYSDLNHLVETINSTILTKEAISVIENSNEVVPKAVQLVEQYSDGSCRITQEGLSYIEYYKWSDN